MFANCRWYATKDRKQYGFPNSIAIVPPSTLVIVAWKSKEGDDFSLSKAAVDYAIAVQDDRKATARAYVVLAKGEQNGEKEFVKQLTLNRVRDIIKGHAPIKGNFGPFWWLSENETVAGHVEPL